MKKDKSNTGIILGGLLLLGAVIGIVIYIKGRKKPTPEPIKPDPQPFKVLKDAYDNLVFEFNKDVIKQQSYPFLDEIVSVLNEAPDWKLKIEGHTDNVGNDKYNLDLSKRRAESVKKYLVSKGIKEDRITSEGFGESKPIADNNTEEGRGKNRRVEFKINKPDGAAISTEQILITEPLEIKDIA